MLKKIINAYLNGATKFYGKSENIIESFCWEQILDSLNMIRRFLLKREHSLIEKRMNIGNLTLINFYQRSIGRLEVIMGIFLRLFGSKDRRFKFIQGIGIKLSQHCLEEQTKVFNKPAFL